MSMFCNSTFKVAKTLMGQEMNNKLWQRVKSPCTDIFVDNISADVRYEILHNIADRVAQSNSSQFCDSVRAASRVFFAKQSKKTE